MGYKSFRVNLIIRIILFSVSVFLFFYLLEEDTYLTPILPDQVCG